MTIPQMAQLTQRFYNLLSHISPGEFNRFALDLFQFQVANNAPYRNYCRALGISELSDWKAIPAVPQQAFKHFDLRAFPKEQTIKIFRTSGTTGESFGQHHFCDLGPYEASILQGWRYFQLPEGLPQMVLTPCPEEAPHSSLFHMMGVLEKVATPSSYPRYFINNGKLDVEEFLHQIEFYRNRNQPILVLGTALAFLNLFETIGERRVCLPQGSQIMETGGYKGSGRVLTKEELYKKFTDYLGVESHSIINEYGMTELSSPFYTRGIDAPHRSVPWARAQVINPQTQKEVNVGEVGALKLIDLANIGSVLAIQTQDLAVRCEDEANGTSAFLLLGRDPSALAARGCSRAADEMLNRADT